MDMTREDLLSKIRKMYDGYAWNGKISVYNPFSTLMFFENKKFSNYWFETGTPTFRDISTSTKKAIRSKCNTSPAVRCALLGGQALFSGMKEGSYLLMSTKPTIFIAIKIISSNFAAIIKINKNNYNEKAIRIIYLFDCLFFYSIGSTAGSTVVAISYHSW